MTTTKTPLVIFLCISSSNEQVYSEMRDILRILFTHYGAKYFFVEYRPEQTEEISEENNYIYVKGEESYIPGIYNKTIKALQYIEENYSYDYVVRTNLSTFWNLPNLFDFLRRRFSDKPFELAGGFNIQGFLSGTCIILSRDVSIILYNKRCDTYSYHDDVLISNTLRQMNIELYNITEYKWGFLIPVIDNLPANCRYLNIEDDDFSDILYFRLKNADRNQDVVYMKILLKKMYNIHVE